jgi:RHS repeat-associated protein
VTLTYTAPSGTNAAFTVKYTNYPVRTNFGCTGISDYGTNGTTTASLISEIDLPDWNATTNPNSRYTFAYEPTPSHSGFVTGRLASVTLPTGGTISYVYTGGSSGNITCADGSTSGLQRSTPDTGSNYWNYSRTPGTGAAYTTTITDPERDTLAPNGNDTVIQFQGIYESQRQVYQASHTAGTLLRQWTTCYNTNTSNCNTTAITLPITQRNVTDQYGSSGPQCQHIYKYNSVGGLIEQDDYDYPSATALLRKTLITYASLNNITAFRQQVTVQNGAGTPVSQTNYNYDEPNTLTTTSGIAQHTSVTGSRGNLTSINYPVSGLTSHFKYYDTGSPNTSQDVNGATTTYNYGTDNAANCQMAFPTSISEPLSMSRSMSWNCMGGVQLNATDENSQVTSTTYNDPYFWRPNDVTDQLANQTAITYQPNSTNCCPWAVASSLTFNNGNSVAIHVQYKDGLGRRYVDQQLQGPGSSTLDSVSYTFDANGRSYSVSVPCAASWAATCSTPKTKQTYDALNRPLVTTDGGGGTVTYSYSSNDVLVTVGPAPSGENTKRRQLEYDALGRLTSVCELTAGASPWLGGTCAQNISQIGYWTKYTYDALGDLLTVAQNAQSSGNQQTRTYTYDAMGRLTAETNPESGTVNLSYDTVPSSCYNYGDNQSGDLTRRSDANGNTICPHYDSLHRLSDVGSSGPNTTPCKRFRYDAGTNGVSGSIPSGITANNIKGRLMEAETDNCSAWPPTPITDEWFSYTARGETSDVYESSPHSGVYYHSASTYWANGALNQLNAYVGSTLNYSANWNVDGEGRPYSNYPVTSTTYNAASQPAQVNFTWGDSDSYAYDPNTGRMKQYQFTVNGQSNTGALTWNPNGTLGSLNITDAFNSANTQTCNYAHDDLVRIVSANCGSAAAQTFSYDPFGNLNKAGSPYSFNAFYSTSTNRISCIGGSGQNCAGGVIPAYDSNGNITSDSNHTYAWDADGNSVSLDGVAITFDALDRMVEQNRSGAYTQFVYSPTGFKMQILNGQTVTRNFVPLPGGSTAVYNTTAFQDVRHRDWLGSSRFASTASRTMYYDGAYAPFGEPYAQSGSAELSFTGMNSDTTSGVYDFMYREYSDQGRWPSPDPAGLAAVDPTNPQSWNRYSYVLNRPINSIDRTGLHPAIYAPDCATALDVSPQCSGGGPGSLMGGTGLGAIFGNDIFDAIAGASGTFLSLNMYGQLSFGFSIELYQTTLQLVDALNASLKSGPPCPGCVIFVGNVAVMFPPGDFQFSTSSGWQVTQMNLGTDTLTSGVLPDLANALDYGTWLSSAFPPGSAAASAYLQVFQNMYFAGVAELCAANGSSCQNLASDLAGAVGTPDAPFPLNRLPFPSPGPPPPKPN